MKIYITIMGLTWMLATTAVYAVENGQKLTACLIENTTTEQEKLTQRWAFSVISSHPDMQQFFAYTHNRVLQEKLDKQLADMVSNIFLNQCRNLLLKTLLTEGKQSVEESAKTWGKSAIKGLIDNPQLQQNATAFIKHMRVF